MAKKWWLSKTLWFNILSVLGLIVQYLIDNQMFKDWLVYEGLAIAVINFVLRLITNEGVTK